MRCQQNSHQDGVRKWPSLRKTVLPLIKETPGRLDTLEYSFSGVWSSCNGVKRRTRYSSSEYQLQLLYDSTAGFTSNSPKVQLGTKPTLYIKLYGKTPLTSFCNQTHSTFVTIKIHSSSASSFFFASFNSDLTKPLSKSRAHLCALKFLFMSLSISEYNNSCFAALVATWEAVFDAVRFSSSSATTPAAVSLFFCSIWW